MKENLIKRVKMGFKYVLSSRRQRFSAKCQNSTINPTFVVNKTPRNRYYRTYFSLIHTVLMGAIGVGTAFSGSAYAADIFNGVRGPTNWQADNRITYSKDERGVEKITNNLILKYWDGKDSGKWGFISLPYKFIDTPDNSGKGIGDISVGFGPRGKIDDLHWFSYGALTLPAGDAGRGILLGSGSYDVKFGLLATYLTSDKRYEVDGSLEYNFTGENDKGINPPDQISMGLLGGGKVTDKIRLVTGLESLMKDGGVYSLSSRTVFRYTVSPGLFFELVGDAGIDTKVL